MRINNPDGLDDFTSISGDHLETFSNSDVQFVRIISQNTKNIPRIICETFPNVIVMNVVNSGLTTLGPNSFASCGDLSYLELHLNQLEEIPSGVFDGNLKLMELVISNNKFRKLQSDVFSKIPLNFLNIRGNQFSSISRDFLAPLNQTLVKFDASFNEIEEISTGSFNDFINLSQLDLGKNKINILDSTAFLNTPTLKLVYLDDNEIEAIDVKFFDDKPDFEFIDLRENLCVNQSFSNLQIENNREEMMKELQGCFEAFEERIEVRCEFSATNCDLRIYNPGNYY